MRRPNVEPKELYTIPEASRALGIDRRTLRRYTDSGAIVCHIRKADGRIVYYGESLLKCYYTVV